MKYFYRNFMFSTCYIHHTYRILSSGNHEYLNYKDVRWQTQGCQTNGYYFKYTYKKESKMKEKEKKKERAVGRAAIKAGN